MIKAHFCLDANADALRRDNMKTMVSILFLPVMILAVSSHFVSAQTPAEKSVFIREDFDNLDGWRPLTFPKIKNHTEYTITANGNESELTARSRASASGLILKETFDPNRFPIVHWRWKVDSVYPDADPRTKAGDDYPLRVYVIFAYDPEKVGLAARTKYGLAKLIYGEYPPLAGLNYVWAGRPVKEKIFPNPFTDRAIMIVLREGPELAGQWVEETVDILNDYKSAFGDSPPNRASLAIMNDSDNTGGASVSHMDYIEVHAIQ
jgi:hypothetical protein